MMIVAIASEWGFIGCRVNKTSWVWQLYRERSGSGPAFGDKSQWDLIYPPIVPVFGLVNHAISDPRLLSISDTRTEALWLISACAERAFGSL